MASRAVDIKEKASVDRWLAKAEALNQRAETIIKEATNVLADLKDVAEGLFFNKVVSYANQVLEGLTEIMQGVRKLCDVVNNVVEWGVQKVGELLQNAADTVGKIWNG